LTDTAALSQTPHCRPIFFTRTYTTDLKILGQARADLREACLLRPCIPLDRLTLVASELLCNAILYGEHHLPDTSVLVRLDVSEVQAKLEVIGDGQPFALPNINGTPPSPHLPYGRGLYLVAHFSTRWGQEVAGQGRLCMWSEFDLSAD
jgi:anti-sigma regulatory factor (Ser/Thr protein kinase)